MPISKGNLADSGFGSSDILAEHKALLERLEEGDFAPLAGLFPARIRPLAARVPCGTLYQWRKRGRLIVHRPQGQRAGLLSPPGSSWEPRKPAHFPPIPEGQAVRLMDTMLRYSD